MGNERYFVNMREEVFPSIQNQLAFLLIRGNSFVWILVKTRKLLYVKVGGYPFSGTIRIRRPVFLFE